MIENILEVRIDDEIFGIDSDKISHILRIPPITPLAVVDNSIKGISVILGKIITIVDIGVLLNLNNIDIKNDKARILSISDDTAILVDEVLDMIEVNPENYEESGEEIIEGFYKSDEIIQVLNIENLLYKITPKEFKTKKIDIVSQHRKENKQKDENFIRSLFFRLGTEKFCIDISFIREIIFIPEITPNNNQDELGLITLRDEVIPIIDLPKLFGFETLIDERSRAVIVKYENGLVGLLVDEIEEVKDISISMIEKMENSEIEGIFKGDELASQISNKFLMELIQKYNISENVEESLKGDTKMIEVVVFKINDEEFAFDINSVQEIIKNQKATFFPQAPNFVEGLLNLRGNVIPIISLPKKLNFTEKIDEKSKIIVCNVANEKVGFIVDDVSDIMFIETENISKVENEESIFDEVINLDERVIFKIDITRIFSDEEIDAIKLTKENNG